MERISQFKRPFVPAVLNSFNFTYYLRNYENGVHNDIQTMKQIELFWNQIMMINWYFF